MVVTQAVCGSIQFRESDPMSKKAASARTILTSTLLANALVLLPMGPAFAASLRADPQPTAQAVDAPDPAAAAVRQRDAAVQRCGELQCDVRPAPRGLRQIAGQGGG